MSLESRRIHKETATAIFTGILVNFPLNFSLLYLWVEVLKWNSAFKIAVCTTTIMTVVAYARVYTIRRHFTKQNAKEIAESQS
jgi:hypothetical protein